MSGEDILKALASLAGALAVAPLLAAHRAEVDKEVDALRAEVAASRVDVAELRGAAQPVLRSLERLQHTMEGRR